MKTKKNIKVFKEVVAKPKKEAKEKKVDHGKSTLIICEKPQASQKIAAALSNNTDELIKEKNGVSYYEFQRDGKNVFVGCAVGHLFGIKQIEKRGPFPNFDVAWKPNYETQKSDYTKKYFDVLKKLSKDCGEFIVATDYDIEGEVIGWNVIRFICGKNYEESAKRMKFSSLTKDEINNAYENLQPNLNWGEAYAGETRHYLDWFYGINLSRGLMKAISQTGQFRILSIGRVQGPGLKIIYDKELTIDNFKPEPYWQIFLNVRDLNKQKLEVKFPKDIFDEKELLKFKYMKGQKGQALTTEKEEATLPPTPFDLTTLQTESYRMFGFTPAQTLSITQGLYLDGVVSYPRTSSQKYPEAIGYDKIIKSLNKYTTLTKYAVNKKPTEGEKTDPAHPAIYPTGEMKKTMNESEAKVYDLIVKRFLACFCLPAIVLNKKVSIKVLGLEFSARGVHIVEKNWMHVYPTSTKEEELITMNGEVNVDEIRTEEKQTKPPQRYSAASLVKELEKRNLGTKATRSNIVETLYDRGYIKEKSIELSPLGRKVIQTLEKYSPVIIDDELTRKFEDEMESITEAKSDWKAKEEKIKEAAKVSIVKIAESITKNLDKIGQSLAEASTAAYEQQKQENTLSQCPNCKKGNLRIMFSRKTKKSFIGCSGYPDCKTIFSLPPSAMIKKTDKTCESCGFPMLMSLKRGKKPWFFCFNSKCKTNEEWVKKRDEYFKNKNAEAGNTAETSASEEGSEEKVVEDKSHEETEME